MPIDEPANDNNPDPEKDPVPVPPPYSDDEDIAYPPSIDTEEKKAKYREALAETGDAEEAEKIANGGGEAVDYEAGSYNNNDVHHVFGQSKHNLDQFKNEYGSEEKAYDAIVDAAVSAAKRDNTPNRVPTKTVETISGYSITIEYIVIDGKVKISTAYIPD